MAFLVAGASSDGRFSAVPVVTDRASLDALVDDLFARGRGYLEVGSQDREWPAVAVSVLGAGAVVHLFDSPEAVSLLDGGGYSVAASVDVIVASDVVTFDGRFVVSHETAAEVIDRLARGELPGPYAWHRI